jgi:Mg-chelatase subunit ChlD
MFTEKPAFQAHLTAMNHRTVPVGTPATTALVVLPKPKTERKHKHGAMVVVHAAGVAKPGKLAAVAVAAAAMQEVKVTQTLTTVQMVGGQKKKKVARRWLNVHIGVDISGSMLGSKIVSAIEGVGELIGLLKANDRLTIYAFADNVRIVFQGTGAPDDCKRALAAVAVLAPGGGTALYDGVLQAMVALQQDGEAAAKRGPERKGSKVERRMAECIFLTDGQDNSSRPGSLAACVGLLEASVHRTTTTIPNFQFTLLAVGDDASQSTAIKQLTGNGAHKRIRLMPVADSGTAIKEAFKTVTQNVAMKMVTTKKTTTTTTTQKAAMMAAGGGPPTLMYAGPHVHTTGATTTKVGRVRMPRALKTLA